MQLCLICKNHVSVLARVLPCVLTRFSARVRCPCARFLVALSSPVCSPVCSPIARPFARAIATFMRKRMLKGQIGHMRQFFVFVVEVLCFDVELNGARNLRHWWHQRAKGAQAVPVPTGTQGGGPNFLGVVVAKFPPCPPLLSVLRSCFRHEHCCREHFFTLWTLELAARGLVLAGSVQLSETTLIFANTDLTWEDTSRGTTHRATRETPYPLLLTSKEQ